MEITRFLAMSGRLGRAAITVVMVVMIGAIVGQPDAAAETGTDPLMCAPVTLDDLFPPEPDPDSTTSTTIVEDPEPEVAEECEPFIYEMGWPLADKGRFISGFGSPRDNNTRHHKGTDVAAPKLTPVLSVADGRVGQIHHETGTPDCCWLVVEHNDGWKSWYLHLNNDAFETDDGFGAGIRSDLRPGTRVRKGEVIGWLGDSGNAEATVVHLHFELRNPDGDAVDAWDSLKTAKTGSSYRRHSAIGPYADLSSGASGALVSRFVTEGLHLPCDDPGVRYCPEKAASPEFVSIVATHLAGKQAPAVEGGYKKVSVFSAAPDEATLSQLLGCDLGEGCLPYGVTERELARLAAWIILDGLVNSDPSINPENAVVVPLATAAFSETSLRRLGVLRPCHRLLDANHVLTRSEAVDRIAWWVLEVAPYPCPPPAHSNR